MEDTFTVSDGYQITTRTCQHRVRVTISHFDKLEKDEDQQSIGLSFTNLAWVFRTTIPNLGSLHRLVDKALSDQGTGGIEALLTDSCDKVDRIIVVKGEEGLRTWVTYDLFYEVVRTAPALEDLEMSVIVDLLHDEIESLMAEVGGNLAKFQHMRDRRKQQSSS